MPFLLSIILLAISVYIRLQLSESPVFLEMKAAGKTSRAPLTDSFARWANLKIVLLALLGATAGQAVVWYGGQFYSLFFLTQTLKVDAQTANLLVAGALLLATPFFVVFGWLSDRIGRKKIVLGGCLLAALTYFPLFGALTHFANPAIERRAADESDHRRRRSGRLPLPVRSDRQGALHQLVRHREERAGEGRRAVRERGCARGRGRDRCASATSTVVSFDGRALAAARVQGAQRCVRASS